MEAGGGANEDPGCGVLPPEPGVCGGGGDEADCLYPTWLLAEPPQSLRPVCDDTWGGVDHPQLYCAGEAVSCGMEGVCCLFHVFICLLVCTSLHKGK